MPFRNIPSPVEGYESYADYYFMQCIEKFSEWGIQAEIESTGRLYESGAFNDAIKIILNNAEKVKKILLSKGWDKDQINSAIEQVAAKRKNKPKFYSNI
mgnify:CR=1 FL=1